MGEIKTLTFPLLESMKQIKAAIVLRSGGVSKGKYSSLNLSFKSGDDPKKVVRNRELLAKKSGLIFSNLVFPDQCHTKNIQVLFEYPDKELLETDAVITSVNGLAIGVLAADCVPILFYDRELQVVGAAHAGWKGTVEGISQHVVKTMVDTFQTKPHNILVGIGPCIQQINYEVGPEVISAVGKLGTNYSDLFIKDSEKPQHGYVNLPGINRQLLIDSGVLAENIDFINECTFSNPQKYFSARRDGFQSGRFASLIFLK
ncbi:MAG TPA: peptidoglycan editing factor PgeF [Bacteroidales bacterium]|jgi:YfiH family protein|nr:peptidoglycan editing factor PgeF [Bacteroidales bacterium]